MKRSPLRRKVGRLRKRSRIKARGKQANYYAREQADRKAWAQEQPGVCMVCLGQGDYRGLAVHEIERRSQASRSFNRANYLLVCATCHEGPLANMPHAQQLAYKMLRDKVTPWDLEAWLAIGYGGPERVTQAEVEAEAANIKEAA